MTACGQGKDGGYHEPAPRVRFQAPCAGAAQVAAGTIVHTTFYGRRVSFFVTNPKDPIQNHHLRGTFSNPTS